MSVSRTIAACAIILLMVGQPLAQVAGGADSAGSNSVASALSVSIVPPVLPADGQIHPVVVVSLTDSSGKQTVALDDVVVYLTSSQEDVATVQGSVTISAGQSYVVADVVDTLTPGTSIITASSVGLLSAFGRLQTMVPSGFPTTLAVFCSPPFQPIGQNEGELVVEILDQLGRPTRAASPTHVLLSSSNSSVVNPSLPDVTVPVNQTVVTVSYVSDPYRPTAGSATITASASGFNSGYGQMTVDKGAGGVPARISLQSDPAQLIADGRSYTALTVMLQDANGSATAAPPYSNGVYVELTSSQPSVVSVPPVALIPPGKSYALVSVTSSASPGGSTITAAAAGLASASVPITTVAPAPSKLALYVAPEQAVVTSRGSQALFYVQLQDGDGNPALGRAITDVVITSSNSSLVDSAIKLAVPRGEDYGVGNITLYGNSQGILTASSPGLQSSNATLRSFIAPFQTTLTNAKPSIYQNETEGVTLTLYALGVPLKGVSVSWSASGGSVTRSASTTDAAGRTSVVFTPLTAGTATVTATFSSPALGRNNLTAPFLVLPVPPKHDPTLLERILSYWLYIAVAGVAAALGVLFLVVRRRGRRGEAADESFELGSV